MALAIQVTSARSLHHPDPTTIDHPAVSLVPRCAIATVDRDHPRADHPTGGHRETSLRDTARALALARLPNFPKVRKKICGNCLNLEFGLIQPFVPI
jgi:hypothetical protein